MGVNVNDLRFLLYAKSAGVYFTRTAMIGRQGLHLAFAQFRNVIGTEFNHNVDLRTLEAIYSEKYCDELLRYWGASVVHSFDYSDYERSTHAHDFNRSIPEEYLSQYTAVVEGDTLEHIFDFPIAIKNCMRMIKVGGHYLGISPANNHMGHVFYQFSPELYLRVFSRGNGLRIEHMFLHEGREPKKWYNVPDPEDVKSLVGIRNSMETLLIILATRLEDCPIFSSPPLQSTWVSSWNEIKPESKVSITKNSLSILRRRIPQSVENRMKRIFRWSNIGPLFSPFDPCESQIASKKLQQPKARERRR